MRTNYPTAITEDEAALRAVERRVRGRPVAVRVQALRLLKSGAARSLAACARLVGHSPRQVARWWTTYRHEGLDALLREPARPGKASRLTPAAAADLEAAMAEGRIATLKDAQAYLAARHGIVYRSLNGVWAQRRKRKTKLKAGRRRHELAEARATRVWAFDEGRFGLRVGLRKRWCPRGVRPPWVVPDRYEWLWLYAAVEPATGRGFFLLLPRVTKEWFGGFLAAFGRETAGERVALVLDGSGSHRADIPWPEHVAPLPLPPYSPGLNPAEQVFRVLRPRPANRIFATVAELEEAIAAHLRPYWDEPALLRRLTGYPWWVNAVTTMPPSP